MDNIKNYGNTSESSNGEEEPQYVDLKPMSWSIDLEVAGPSHSHSALDEVYQSLDFQQEADQSVVQMASTSLTLPGGLEVEDSAELKITKADEVSNVLVEEENIEDSADEKEECNNLFFY